MKNQHLFASSIAQYDVEVDPRNADYRQKEKDFFSFRRRMEKTYPQVCQDCEPNVQRKLREAGLTAKADHLRRMMDKTRARRGQRKSSGAGAGFMGTLGKLLWYLGLVGQLIWSLGEIISAQSKTPITSGNTQESPLATSLAPVLNIFTSTSYVRAGILCSILSCWWNPMFYQFKTGFVNHIVGFGDWYKFQVLLIISRLLFYYIIQSPTMVLSNPQANIGAHGVMLIFTLLVSQYIVR